MSEKYALVPVERQWTHDKPATPGAYWVRGFRLGEPDSRPALIEVARNEEGGLLCNINDSNTNDDTREWSFVEDLAERFEWCGPLAAAPATSPASVVVPSIPQQWSKSLESCWPADDDYPGGDWIVGAVDEDGNRYEVLRVEAEQYDAEGESQKIAEALVKLLAFADAAAPVPVQQAEGTTSDKYRAELYDEVWQLAKGMGYGNVTMALSDLAAFKAQQAEQKPVAWRVLAGHSPRTYDFLSDAKAAVKDWLRHFPNAHVDDPQPLFAAPQPASAPGTVSVPVELLDQAATWLEVHAPGGGCVEGSVAEDLRALLSRHERGGE